MNSTTLFQVKWTYDLRSYKRNFYNCVEKPGKIQDLNGIWTRDLAISVRRSNQLSYEATDIGNGIWNESYMKCGYEIKWSYDLLSYKRNFYNCVEKPGKFRT